MAAPLGQETTHLPPNVRDIISKARTSWLKNSEVMEILLTYKTHRFPVGKEAPDYPGGGVLFLFDRKAVRFFRKDGHEWRKKADGKTVRETHEKLKIGNKDVLNCYYAHSEAKEALQRRCYWLLEGEGNIVLVHYLSSLPPVRLQSVPPAAVVGPQGDGIGCIFRVRGDNGAMVRAASAPNKVGSTVQQRAFTVTTGESLLLESPDAHMLPEPTAAVEVASAPGSLAGPHRHVLQGQLMAMPGNSSHQYMDRATSTPILPSNAQVGAACSLPAASLDRSNSLGPLHSAPSFSAGTVQTGSTLSPTALQPQQEHLQHGQPSNARQDSRHSSQSAALEPAFSTEPAPPASDGNTSSQTKVLPTVIRIPLSHRAEAWGNARQTAAEADAWGPGGLGAESKLAETDYELKPAMSLTRVDSDTLKVAPSLSKATSGLNSLLQSGAALQCEPATEGNGEVAQTLRPSAHFSPFYAAAFLGNAIRAPKTLAEELLAQHALTVALAATNAAAQAAGLQHLPESAPAPVSALDPLELSRSKRHRSNNFGSSTTAVAAKASHFQSDGRAPEQMQPLCSSFLDIPELDAAFCGPDAEPVSTAADMPDMSQVPLNWLIASGKLRELGACLGSSNPQQGSVGTLPFDISGFMSAQQNQLASESLPMQNPPEYNLDLNL